MAGLNQRERTMVVFIIVIVVAFAHIYGAKKLAEFMREKRVELSKLELKAKEYEMGGNLVGAIEDEKEWLEKVEPDPKVYENVQSELQKFLASSSSSLGLEPFAQKFLLDEGYVSINYRRARVQISVQGEQNKVVQWVTQIHQPDQFRGVTYLKLLPSKVEGEVVCHLIAEQWLVPKM